MDRTRRRNCLKKRLNGAANGESFFYSVNKDYPEEEKSHNGFSRKLKADLFIDDRNLGVCLTGEPSTR